MRKDKIIKVAEERGLVPIEELEDEPKSHKCYSYIDKKGYKYFLTYDSMRDKRTKRHSIVSPNNPFTIENIQTYIYNNGGNAKVISTKWDGAQKKIQLRCQKCGKDFEVSWYHIYSLKKFQCNKCSYDRGYDKRLKEKTEKTCQKHGYRIIEGTYVSRGCFDMVDKQGYKYGNTNIANLNTRTNKFQRFTKINKYQIENMRLYLKLNNIPIEIEFDDNFSVRNDYITAICIECGERYKTKWSKIVGNYITPQWRCQKCNKRKSNLEYMVEQYLIRRGVKYTLQKRFEWCRNKRMLPFDFYLDDYNTVIEVNGNQHYYENRLYTLNLKEQRERDNLKKNSCIENDINYVEIPFWLISQSKCETYKKIIDNIID